MRWRGGILTACTLVICFQFTASLLLASPRPYGVTRPPDHLRLRLKSVIWGGTSTEATDYFDAAPGDDIDGPRAYLGWDHFGPGAPFRLGRIVDAEHAWVHFSGGIRPRALRTVVDPPAGSDSILVSTVDRTFTTDSFDAGLDFSLRIEPPNTFEASWPPSGMQLVRHRPVVIGPPGFREHVESAEAAGIFKILAIRPGRDSLRFGDRIIGTTEIEAIARELWSPGPLQLGEQVRLIQERAPATDSSWAPPLGGTPLYRGRDVILFMFRGRTGPFDKRWTFSPYDGYGLLANDGALVFSAYGRGVPIEKFRRDVQLVERMRFNPGRAVLMGRVLHAGSGTPIAGAEVRVEGGASISRSAANGWFELFDLPIGQRRVLVRDSLGEVALPIDLSDEVVDSLELRVAQPRDPDPSPLSSDSILAEARARARRSGFFRLEDVHPMPYLRSDPAYPEEARKARFEGDIGVWVRVDSSGRSSDIRAEGNAAQAILAAAEASVRGWRFRPGLKNGRPIGCQVGVSVHFAHPTSGDLAAPLDRRCLAVAEFPGTPTSSHAEVVVEASATLDSVTRMYRYSYRVSNRHGSTRHLVAFSLMPTAPVEELVWPEGWTGFLGCGGRQDVVGWYAWGGDQHDRVWDYAVAPDQEVAGMTFKSPRPPARVRWFANTMPYPERGKLVWDCGTSIPQTMLETPLQGTIVGPAPP